MGKEKKKKRTMKRKMWVTGEEGLQENPKRKRKMLSVKRKREKKDRREI